MASNSDCKNLAHPLKELLQSNYKFALDIYKNLVVEEYGDLIFSPISLQIALLLLLSGAAGETAEELENRLNFVNKRKKEVLQGAMILLETLKLKNPNLKIATQIFIAKQYPIEKKYEKLVKQYLESTFKTVNFEKSPAKAVAEINSWVSKKTENMIPSIISADDVNEETCSVLVNAAHFKDDWLIGFSESETTNKLFYSAVDSIVEVPMMSINGNFRYLKEKSFGVLEIPYKSDDFSFLIFLPDEIDGLPNLEMELLKMEFDEILDDFSTSNVNLQLPKMKIEKSIGMKDVLKQLGIEAMFGKSADFSEMYSRENDSDRNVYVDDVVHKAVIEVNEGGGKAATVTYVRPMPWFSRKCIFSKNEERSIDFIVDHPFIFMILHRDVILFMGKKTDAL